MFQFVPFEFPSSIDGEYICILDDAGVLRARREQLGLTQQQVADMAGIHFSQYQRLEAGESSLSSYTMKAGLAICAILLLNPYEFLAVDVEQPDPATIKPHPPFDANIPDVLKPKRPGRKQARRNIMTVYVNYRDYSLLIPYDALSQIGDPSFVQIRWNIAERRILIGYVTVDGGNSFDVPKNRFDQAFLAFPALLGGENPISAMHWGKEPYAVESRLVRGQDEHIYILIDLNTAKPADPKSIEGVFYTPECLLLDDDDEEGEEDDD